MVFGAHKLASAFHTVCLNLQDLIGYIYDAAAPPALVPPVSPSPMRTAVYVMLRERGRVLRRGSLVVTLRSGRSMVNVD